MKTKMLWACLAVTAILAAGCQRGAQTEKAAGKGGNPAGASGAKVASVLELGCVPADCFAAVVIHPRRVFQSPQAAQSAEVKKLLESQGYEELVKQIGFDLRDVEEVTFLVFAPPPAKRAVPQPAVVLRFAQPIDRERIIGSLGGKEYSRSEQTHAGKTYYKLSPPKKRRYAEPKWFFAPDDRTIVFMEHEEGLFKELLSRESAHGPLAEALRRADMSHDAVGVAVMQPMHPLVAWITESLAVEGPPEFRDAKLLAGQVKGAMIVADVFGDPCVRGVVETESLEVAAKLLAMAQKGHELSRQRFQGMRQRRAQESRKLTESEVAMDEFASELLSGLSISQREAALEVVIRVKNPERPLGLVLAPMTEYAEVRRPAMIAQAKVQIQAFKTPLLLYRKAMGEFPPVEIGLTALMEPTRDSTGKTLDTSWIEALPMDPWGMPYQYQYPSKHGRDTPDIWSNGPDGVAGTHDDIRNGQE